MAMPPMTMESNGAMVGYEARRRALGCLSSSLFHDFMFSMTGRLHDDAAAARYADLPKILSVLRPRQLRELDLLLLLDKEYPAQQNFILY